VFGEMSALATRLGAVNLGQGFPDTDGPDEIKAVAMAAIADGSGNQYPPAHGQPDLRRAIAEHQERFYGLRYDPDTEVVVGTGASECIGSAILGLVDTDDEVVVLEPYFDIYAPHIAMARGRRVAVPLTAPFRPDAEAIAAAVTPRTRVLLLNTPHNPTGSAFSRDELEAIADIARRHDLVVLSDEVYEHLVYDGTPHVPIAGLPGMRERTLTVGSGGKSFSFTGWKVGWITGPADLVLAARVARQHLSYVSGGPFQPAIAAALRLPDSYFATFAAGLAAQRDHLVAGLRSVGLDPAVPQGTYFVVTDATALGYESGAAMAGDLPERAGVAVIPVSAFCDHPGPADRFVRWTFCKRPEVLAEAVARMQAAFG
jgi:N-succinyldiaminopimelate aminotransferase